MIIFLGLLKEDLEADEAGLPAKLINIPENILAQLAKDSLSAPAAEDLSQGELGL